METFVTKYLILLCGLHFDLARELPRVEDLAYIKEETLLKLIADLKTLSHLKALKLTTIIIRVEDIFKQKKENKASGEPEEAFNELVKRIVKSRFDEKDVDDIDQAYRLALRIFSLRANIERQRRITSLKKVISEAGESVTPLFPRLATVDKKDVSLKLLFEATKRRKKRTLRRRSKVNIQREVEFMNRSRQIIDEFVSQVFTVLTNEEKGWSDRQFVVLNKKLREMVCRDIRYPKIIIIYGEYDWARVAEIVRTDKFDYQVYGAGNPELPFEPPEEPLEKSFDNISCLAASF